ncbi:MAG: hypothetical protein AMXMBFR53_02840 [Gemmatimonadota bacterium]
MRKSLLTLSAAALLALPAAAAAQGFAVAGRAGTLGLGAEGAVGLTDSFVLRGGIGLIPLEVDATSFWDVGDDVEATLTLPKTWFNVGADLYLGSGFRIGGGMLFKPDDPEVAGSLTGSASIDIGGKTYTATEVASVTGTLDAKDQAPYVLLGFGKHTRSGIGLFLDLGVAFMGDPEIALTATGNSTVINSAEFQSRLRTEEQSLNDDLPTWAKKYWPIINIGVKFGLGG